MIRARNAPILAHVHVISILPRSCANFCAKLHTCPPQHILLFLGMSLSDTRRH